MDDFVSFPPSDSQNLCTINWINHSNHILKQLKLFFGPGGMFESDVNVVCGGGTVRCHQILLAIGSDYFADIFTENPFDRTRRIELSEISAKTFRYIYQFMLYGTIALPLAEVNSFVEIGEKLKVVGLMNLPKGMPVDNATGKYSTSVKNSSNIGKTLFNFGFTKGVGSTEIARNHESQSLFSTSVSDLNQLGSVGKSKSKFHESNEEEVEQESGEHGVDHESNEEEVEQESGEHGVDHESNEEEVEQESGEHGVDHESNEEVVEEESYDNESKNVSSVIKFNIDNENKSNNSRNFSRDDESDDSDFKCSNSKEKNDSFKVVRDNKTNTTDTVKIQNPGSVNENRKRKFEDADEFPKSSKSKKSSKRGRRGSIEYRGKIYTIKEAKEIGISCPVCFKLVRLSNFKNHQLTHSKEKNKKTSEKVLEKIDANCKEPDSDQVNSDKERCEIIKVSSSSEED